MKTDLNITVCPGTLAAGFTTYSPKCRKEMFDGKKVGHVLSFPSPQQDDEQQKLFIENKIRISISGVQEKYSLKLSGNLLQLTSGHGEYILKPIPADLLNISQVPANEHLTMQIAAQVFKLPVAKNALIFFNDGQPAYLTRRFDVMPDGKRCLIEDFASLAAFTSKNSGNNYKYNYSYLEISLLIDQYFPAATMAKESFFQLVIFNYLFSNGDAHLKNFSRLDCSGMGDAFLAPAYDLLNTRLHVDDSDLALIDGLYKNDYSHPSYSSYGAYAFDDFVTFGILMQLNPIRIKRMITKFLTHQDKINLLIDKSFLNSKSKLLYKKDYEEKHRRLAYSFSGNK